MKKTYQLDPASHIASLATYRTKTYNSKEPMEKPMVVNEAMDRRLLPRCRACQVGDPEFLHPIGTEVAR